MGSVRAEVEDILDETLRLFRAQVFFKNYEVGAITAPVTLRSVLAAQGARAAGGWDRTAGLCVRALLTHCTASTDQNERRFDAHLRGSIYPAVHSGV
jgi:hypothetical protein